MPCKIDKALRGVGVSDPVHQRILLDNLPCGESAAGALADKTAVQINAPRALCIVFWKGMVSAFVKLEAQQKGG